MENPILRLVVEKGPKAGEVLECKPGARTRIGRVVRGNTFAIRDPGISQKHLAFEFLRETSRWVVSDLDTSNGTLVNDANIRPSVPFPLSDGDSVKIGEMTSICIRIAGEEPHIDAAAAAAEEEEERTGVRRRGRRRGAPPARPGAEQPSGAIVDDVGSEAPARNGGRARGRPKKTAASATVPKKDDILDAVVVVEESAEAPKNAGKGRGRRRPRARAASARVSKEEEEEEVKPLGSVPVSNSESVEPAEEGDFLRLEAGNAGEGAKLAESGEGEVRRGEGEEDMDKMTLGEWFGRMEKYLPLMINDISEEVISSLREKARRFDDFVARSVHAS